jgi:hypothetical protein
MVKYEPIGYVRSPYEEEPPFQPQPEGEAFAVEREPEYADVDRMLADVEEVTAGMPTFPTNVKHGDGLENLFNYLDEIRARGHAPSDDGDRDPVRPSEVIPNSIRL